MYFSIWPSCLAHEKLMDAYGEEKTQTRAELSAPDSNLELVLIRSYSS